MERREFTKAAALAGIATACTATNTWAASEKSEPRELYELRTYVIPETKLPFFDSYVRDALLPAVERMSLGPIGVFEEVSRSERLIASGGLRDSSPAKGFKRLLVLIVHKASETLASLPLELASDKKHLEAAREFYSAKPDDPAYTGLMTSLLHALAVMPKLEKPDTTQPRLFNLRVYQSHNERAAAKKIELFETAELAIFRQCGLTPVFFSSAIAGTSMPNLHYLLVFPDEAARVAAWKKFGSDPEWKKLAALPDYADREIVSKIVNVILTPRPYSQL